MKEKPIFVAIIGALATIIAAFILIIPNLKQDKDVKSILDDINKKLKILEEQEKEFLLTRIDSVQINSKTAKEDAYIEAVVSSLEQFVVISSEANVNGQFIRDGKNIKSEFNLSIERKLSDYLYARVIVDSKNFLPNNYFYLHITDLSDDQYFSEIIERKNSRIVTKLKKIGYIDLERYLNLSGYQVLQSKILKHEDDSKLVEIKVRYKMKIEGKIEDIIVSGYGSYK